MLTSEAIEGTADSDEGKGDEGDDNKEEPPKPLPPVSPLSKILVAFAGPLMNVVFAIVIAVLLWQIGLPRQVNEPVIGYVATHSEEYKIGVRPGDRILAINDKPVEAWQDVIYTVLDSDGLHGEIENRAGQGNAHVRCARWHVGWRHSPVAIR